MPHVLAAAISLAPAATYSVASDEGLRGLFSYLDDSPPSVYAFEPGDEPWRSDSSFSQLQWNDETVTRVAERVFYCEWIDDEGEHRKSVWLVAK